TSFRTAAGSAGVPGAESAAGWRSSDGMTDGGSAFSSPSRSAAKPGVGRVAWTAFRSSSLCFLEALDPGAQRFRFRVAGPDPHGLPFGQLAGAAGDDRLAAGEVFPARLLPRLARPPLLLQDLDRVAVADAHPQRQAHRLAVLDAVAERHAVAHHDRGGGQRP